jgi:hypothetical protein
MAGYEQSYVLIYDGGTSRFRGLSCNVDTLAGHVNGFGLPKFISYFYLNLDINSNPLSRLCSVASCISSPIRTALSNLLNEW